jgi:hypothetical protein
MHDMNNREREILTDIITLIDILDGIVARDTNFKGHGEEGILDWWEVRRYDYARTRIDVRAQDAEEEALARQ